MRSSEKMVQSMYVMTGMLKLKEYKIMLSILGIFNKQCSNVFDLVLTVYFGSILTRANSEYHDVYSLHNLLHTSFAYHTVKIKLSNTWCQLHIIMSL